MPDFAKDAATKVAHSQELQDAYRKKREAQADAAGLKGQFRDQYVNTIRQNTYEDTFWDRFREFFGGKRGSKAFQESLDLKDSAYLSELQNAQREQDYNDISAQAERMRAAGFNPDLNGGEGLTSSEASQIDDEVFGSGLTEQLSGIQSKPAETFSNAAQLFMNGATSILGLVRGGFDIAGLVQGQDLASMSSLFDFGQKTIDYLYNPSNPQIFSDPYFNQYKNADGMLDLSKIDWDRYYREKFGIRSPKIRKQLKNMASPYKSPMYLANQAEAAKKSSDAEKGIVENEQYIEGRIPGRDLAWYDSSGASFIKQLQSNETYQQFVQNAAKLQLESMRASISQQELLAKYYEALNKTPYAERKALKESFLQEYESEALKAQMTAAQQVNANIQELVKQSESGDWMSTLLLQSIISGSFQTFGLGDPMKLPMYFGDKLTGLASDLMGLFTKGLFKPDVRGEAYEKAIGTAMGKRAGNLMK